MNEPEIVEEPAGPCLTCDGHGEVDCEECEGSGENCDACGNIGTTECPDCDGGSPAR